VRDYYLQPATYSPTQWFLVNCNNTTTPTPAFSGFTPYSGNVVTVVQFGLTIFTPAAGGGSVQYIFECGYIIPQVGYYRLTANGISVVAPYVVTQGATSDDTKIIFYPDANFGNFIAGVVYNITYPSITCMSTLA